MGYDEIQIGFEFEFSAKMQSIALLAKLKNDLKIKTDYKNYKRNWRLGHDSSIKNPGKNYYAHELVSPPLPYNSAVIWLEKICKWMLENNCKTNCTTGLHVNMSFKRFHQNKKIDPVKLILFTPSQISRQYKRQRNVYCLSYDNDFKLWSKYLKSKHVSDWQEAASIFAKRLKSKIDLKYRVICFHANYVEFRMIGNKNYHFRVKEITRNINEMIESLFISSNEHACKLEYYQMMLNYIVL